MVHSARLELHFSEPPSLHGPGLRWVITKLVWDLGSRMRQEQLALKVWVRCQAPQQLTHTVAHLLAPVLGISGGARSSASLRTGPEQEPATSITRIVKAGGGARQTLFQCVPALPHVRAGSSFQLPTLPTHSDFRLLPRAETTAPLQPHKRAEPNPSSKPLRAYDS